MVIFDEVKINKTKQIVEIDMNNIVHNLGSGICVLGRQQSTKG